MTTEKQTDIQPMLSTEMGKRSRQRTHRSYHPNDFRGETATETLPNAESRDGRFRIWNVQSGFPRAEAHSYRGEYDYLL
jgi:hypothetical protein